MILKIEPKGFLMQSVFLIFDRSNPDPEDPIIDDYLKRHDLKPKRTANVRFNGRDCERLYFGGCYLKRHLNAVIDLHQKGIRWELVATEIHEMLAKDQGTTEVQIKKVVYDLAEELSEKSLFVTTKAGNVNLIASSNFVCQRALELANMLKKTNNSPSQTLMSLGE